MDPLAFQCSNFQGTASLAPGAPARMIRIVLASFSLTREYDRLACREEKGRFIFSIHPVATMKHHALANAQSMRRCLRLLLVRGGKIQQWRVISAAFPSRIAATAAASTRLSSAPSSQRKCEHGVQKAHSQVLRERHPSLRASAKKKKSAGCSWPKLFVDERDAARPEQSQCVIAPWAIPFARRRCGSWRRKNRRTPYRRG